MKNRLFLFALTLFLPLWAAAQTPAAHKEKEADSSYAFSVFGTAAYSITNRPYQFVRADNHGTFSQLSRIGAQFDAQLSPRYSLSVQAELAPSTYKENHYHPRLSWAFITFRPDNNWSLQLGKVRIPMVINAQNMPVGVTYPQNQLPLEIYHTSPTHEMWGGILGYTWHLPRNQSLTWEGYLGYMRSHLRVFYRGGLYTVTDENTAHYWAFSTPYVGTSIFWQDLEKDRQARLKLFYAPVKSRKTDPNMWVKNPISMEYAPGRSVYLPYGDDSMGIEFHDRIRILFLTLGVKWHLGNEFYFVGEGVLRRSTNINTGFDSSALYLMLNKRWGKWTPYVSIAGIRPTSNIRQYLKAMNVPTGSFELDKLNMSASANLIAMDQWSFALGTAFDITPNQRIKAEWMHTRVGENTLAVSALNTQNFANKAINMFSISYNFLFDF